MSSSADQIPMDVSAIYLDNTSIQVSFTLPTGIVNPYYYYHVVAYDSSGNIYDTSGTTSPIILSGLNESTTYSYYVETIQTASTPIITFRTAQWPKIYVFYASDISYNAAMLNWSGVDFSSVRIVRSGVDVSYVYVDAAGGAPAKYYDGYDLCGNTLYLYYITPYLSSTGSGTAAQTSVFTKVAPITNLTATPTTDGSAITLLFSAAKNSYNTMYYTAKTVGAATAQDVSGTSTTLLLRNLSGNTSYSMYVTVTIDNSSALVATSNTVGATTAVQPPVGTVTFYDNSAIRVNLSSKNTYSTILYSAAASGASTTVGANSPLLIQNLSGNTVYFVAVSNTLNGNSALKASAILSDTVLTKVQPPTSIALYAVDSSAIALSFVPGANTYNTITWTGYATDNTGKTKISTTSVAAPSSIYITDLSGNTTYVATVSGVLDGNSALVASSNTYISTTTAVQPPYNLTLLYYDSSAIKITFKPGRNSYSSYINYIATASTTGGATSSTTGAPSSPVIFDDLSGNTYYTVTVTTSIDGSGSLTAVSAAPLIAKTNVQSLINPSIGTYDSSAVNVLFGDLPRNSYTRTLYYIAEADDLCGNVFNAIADGSLYPSSVEITGLKGKTTYYVRTTVVADGSYSQVVYAGNVTTTNNTLYILEAREIYTIDPVAASIIDLSFAASTTIDTSGTTYYIASIRATGYPDLDVSGATSPISITGLSGNTDYSITIKSNTGGLSNPVNVKTAIQTPRDVEIASLEDASFTVLFTAPRNSGANVYYVLRATDMSGGNYIDVSAAGGELSMYGLDVLTIGSTYSFDILTVVDGSMVSYGELFEIGVNTLYNLEAREVYMTDPVAASTIEVSYYVPRQSVVTYYIVSVRGDGAVPVDISTNTSPILLTGLSGNTEYSITLKSYVGGVTYTLSTAHVKTAIQQPRDVVIASLEDASFTVQFTPGRNNVASGYRSAYYILRATDISSGSYVDVSSSWGELSMYGTSMLASDVMYSFDILTVVDVSMVSYGELFEIGVMTPYNIRAREIYTSAAATSSVNLFFDVPAQSGITYYSASAQAPGRPDDDVDVISYTSPILLTGLSGNTDYSVTLSSHIGPVDYISNPVHVKTAIQTPHDLTIASLEDSSFTVLFTRSRNSSITEPYYILRATDISNGYHVDVSGRDGELSMYGPSVLPQNATYSFDVLTVVDGSMVSYGELFEIGVTAPYNLKAAEINTFSAASASIIDLSFDTPEQSRFSYYVASAHATGCVDVDVSSNSNPIFLTGLSGNTDYSITLTSHIGNLDYISTPVTVKTAIQTPHDVAIASLKDTSFTVVFTEGHNSSTATPYYILRATDIRDGTYIDVSSVHGELSMYDSSVFVTGDTYSVDVLTVVDSSMISYGELFEIVA